MIVWGLWMQNAVVSTIRVHLSKGMVCFALCGHRQAVRPQLPKLVFAGSNPVARSIEPQTVGIPKGTDRFFSTLLHLVLHFGPKTQTGQTIYTV